MKKPGQIAHELSVVSRVAGRALRRRMAGDSGAPVPHDSLRRSWREWLASVPRDLLTESPIFYLPGDRPPWFDTGIDLEPGEQVTVLAAGRVYMSKLLDIWVGAHFQLWARIGPDGEVFRGTRSTWTFRAQRGGRLYLASYFPGEWGDRQGRLGTPENDYRNASGGISVLLLRWARGTDPAAALAELAGRDGSPALVQAEATRLQNPGVIPEGWQYLWYLGPAEIFRRTDAAMACHTHCDVGILQKDAPMPLTPDTRVRWSWRVHELPSELAEDTLPTHDYLSVAVEFDNGQDLSYVWSAELPPGRVYRCPLPTWKDRETHMVLRSGTRELGRWLDEDRNVYEDYRRAVGEPPGGIVRVWLIANSIFQRRHGRCEFRDLRLANAGESLPIIE
ncbi:MAG TPA: DUF3047 domain-containing protein [Gammaproteobacteria bacterium]|nr:DUF3047 domain-containing protein [Gammaproteobacteria bacterium]